MGDLREDGPVTNGITLLVRVTKRVKISVRYDNAGVYIRAYLPYPASGIALH